MTTIVAISGSLRRASWNTMLLRAAAAAAPPGVIVEEASIAGVPLFDADLEAETGPPPAVTALKERIARADGLLLVTPEYIASLPGVLKNAIDWMARPASDNKRVFGDCPVGVMGATPTMGGTGLAQVAWLPVFRNLGTLPYFGARVLVARADRVFDGAGALVDPDVRAQLASYMAGFAEFVTRHPRPRR